MEVKISNYSRSSNYFDNAIKHKPTCTLLVLYVGKIDNKSVKPLKVSSGSEKWNQLCCSCKMLCTYF